MRICEFQMHDSQSYVVSGKSRSCNFFCSLVRMDYWRSLCNVRELLSLNGGITCIAWMHALSEKDPPIHLLRHASCKSKVWHKLPFFPHAREGSTT